MFTGARKKTGNTLAAGCQLFYRKIYGYLLQCTLVEISSMKGNTTLLELSNLNLQYVLRQIIRKESIVKRGTIRSNLNVRL